MLKNEVNFKALSFIAEQTSSTFNFEVKGVRALWDPSLSIPGTNRRGGWRCPVGTRYGGQITDRFGRSCGWGVARRIANQIADIGDRLENIDDRKRNSRVAKRNARMQRFLARQEKPGLLERGARGIAEALDGGQTPRQARTDTRPDIPMRPAKPKPRRQGNLRESEARRMERELAQPGAPRTGEPPKPNAPRRRRVTATQQGAKRTARRKPEADFVDGAKPEPTRVPRRKPAPQPAEPPKPSTPIPSPPTWNPSAEAAAARAPRTSPPVIQPLPNPPKPPSPDLGGSTPDERSMRNVGNRFRQNGLPDTAYWREPDFPEGEEKGELERRFGRYYGGNNKRNARGDYVNDQIRANPQQQGGLANRGGARGGPTPTPPPQPARADVQEEGSLTFNIEQEFTGAEAPIVAIVKQDLARFTPNAYNNLRNTPKDGLTAKLTQLQRERELIDNQYREALASWNRDKNGDANARQVAATGLTQKLTLREKNKIEQAAVNDRIKEIDEGVPFAPRIARAQGAGQGMGPAQRVDAPPPPEGFDVASPKTIADASPEKLGKLDADGIPLVARVEIGNKGLKTKEQAIAFLEEGGDLAEVPDDLLGEALNGATQRFEKSSGGGGVNALNIPNNMFLFKDKRTGKKYFHKYVNGSVAENEDIHEIVGNNLQARFGLSVGSVRMDGPQEGNGNPAHSVGRSIVYEHVGNYVDGSLQIGRDFSNLGRVKVSDRVRATLLDFVIVNRDRHGGNYFIATDADGKFRVVPIDPSLGFDVNWGERAFANMDGDDNGFKGWMDNNAGGGRNQMLNTLRAQYQRGELNRREVIAAIESVQDSIREAERKNPYLNLVDGALNIAGRGNPRNGDNPRERIGVRPQRKMKYLTDVPAGRLADMMLGVPQ